ncbi:MAG TPA: hypothetical protein VK743_16130 [Steroidobacteraceae bacterium]|nr:hypothetical protein [Steroidobacteraceae bacterium]
MSNNKTLNDTRGTWLRAALLAVVDDVTVIDAGSRDDPDLMFAAII